MKSIGPDPETIVRILSDSPPHTTADAAYLFAQTRYNELSVLTVGRQMLSCGTAQKILLLGREGSAAYPGYDSWKRHLVKSGVDEALIGKVLLPDDECHNTLTEALAVIQYARGAQYDALIVSAAPFHQLRAFMTAVTAALRHYPQLKIFSRPGRSLDWVEPTFHSQGSLKAKRHELVQIEYDRIINYCAKGDLVTFEVVLNYLNRRDAASSVP